jgi:hypothetical protein
MNDIQQIYDLIAKGQACTVDALTLATGLDLMTVRYRIAWLRDSGRVSRDKTCYRPARYIAAVESEPPKAYRPREPKKPKVERPVNSGFVALSSAWGGSHA